MSDEQCLPAAPEPVEGSAGLQSDSPTRRRGVPVKVRHSPPSTPLLGGYNSRRFWRPSSTIVWCSAADHLDLDHFSRGRVQCIGRYR